MLNRGQTGDEAAAQKGSGEREREREQRGGGGGGGQVSITMSRLWLQLSSAFIAAYAEGQRQLRGLMIRSSSAGTRG